jgi:putative Holliday junction resolvase
MSGRVLGVDLGLKRTGLAVSDELRLTTRVLPVLTPKSRLEDIRHILKLCEELEVKTLLIGYPLLPQSGEEGFMAKRAKGFYEALKQQASADLEVFLVDESFTSKEAELRTGQSKNLDGESARILIETFIHAQNH